MKTIISALFLAFIVPTNTACSQKQQAKIRAHDNQSKLPKLNNEQPNQKRHLLAQTQQQFLELVATSPRKNGCI